MGLSWERNPFWQSTQWPSVSFTNRKMLKSPSPEFCRRELVLKKKKKSRKTQRGNEVSPLYIVCIRPKSERGLTAIPSPGQKRRNWGEMRDFPPGSTEHLSLRDPDPRHSRRGNPTVCFPLLGVPLSRRQSGHSRALAAKPRPRASGKGGTPRPPDLTPSAGLPAKRAGELAGQTDRRRPRLRPRPERARRRPPPRAAAEPRAGPAVLGDGDGSGSPSSRALGATAAWPCGRGRAETTRRPRRDTRGRPGPRARRGGA